jgi:hypothetical protein
MPDDSTVIVTVRDYDQLLVIDLKSKQAKGEPFQFLDKKFAVSWFYFSESKLICMREVTKIESEGNDRFISQLSYFRAGMLHQPLITVKLDKNDKHCVNMQPGNNHSLLIGPLERSKKGQRLMLVDLLTVKGKVQSRTRYVTYPNDQN